MKKIKLIILFYRNFWFASFLITLACLALLWEYGFSIFSVLFWFKAVTLFIIYQFIKAYKSNEFYYYRNLGLSKGMLWATALGFDMMVFVALMLEVNKLR